MEADAAILIDAVPRGYPPGYPPGTVYLMEPSIDNLGDGIIDPHTMNPVAILQLVRTLGGTTGRVYLVGCEPAALDCTDGPIGLSNVLEEAVPEAVALVESIVADLMYNRNPIHAPVAATR
jgi:hydrogenase maturation protease